MVAGTLTEEELRKALAALHVNADDRALHRLHGGDDGSGERRDLRLFRRRRDAHRMIKDHKDAARILLANTYPQPRAVRAGDEAAAKAPSASPSTGRSATSTGRAQIATIFSEVFGTRTHGRRRQLQTLYMIATLPE